MVEAVADTSEVFVEPLPCESPVLNDWGVAVFGRETDQAGNPRSASTSINRIEFPDLSSSLPFLPSDTAPAATAPAATAPAATAPAAAIMVWDEGAYKGYKLNCFKKKRRVDSLIELYDKDSVNSVQDKDIYKQKLEEISAAAVAAVEYTNELLDELEVNQEVDRIAELTDIKKKVKDSVKKNEREVKAEMERILAAVAAANLTNNAAQTPPVNATALNQAQSEYWI